MQSPTTYFFDFFDPLQGKILGAARQNIDYIGVIDPAKYNAGPVNNNGNFWGSDRVGQIWWDTDSVRFIDPNQDDIVYASRRWGQVFPGSSVDVYQWIASSVPPASYTGPGTPFNTTSYTIKAQLTDTGVVETVYYFWVTGLTTIDTGAGKSLSTTGIARYIEDPRSSGIPYIAALNANTVAIYNGQQFLSASDTILHVEFDQILNDANVHTEFQLIAQNKPESFLAANLYRKLQDSFCGYDTSGAQVPDPFLSPPERFGVQFSPRQSMFVDRFMALQNYLTRANEILKYLPIVELRRFTLLNTSEPVPAYSSGLYNKVVANLEELSYQDLYEVPLGYNYLVLSDSNNNGWWTIYTVAVESSLPGAVRVTQLTRVQTYDTRNYWQYIDWYQLGYNSKTVPVAEVPNYASLATLTNIAIGSSVKVTANAQNKFEIYIKTATSWDRVGLQDGTIEFKAELWDYALGRFGFDVEVFDAQYYDQEPVTETRRIIQSINEELFIDDLAISRNRLLILMFEFILTEQEAPQWLTKTSLIDVRHEIRELVAFQNYRQDNQDFVLNYIQEVKPYHVQIKEFSLVYNGLDAYAGMMTDFDNPAYYNNNLEVPAYVSPILLPYDKSTATGTGTPSDIADTAPNAEIWALTPWSDWFNNYLLSLQSVEISNGGSNYTIEPSVTVGTPWQSNTAYVVGQQIFYGVNLYSVTVAGVSGTTPPEFTYGSNVNGTATLSFAGLAATGTAVINSQGKVSAVIITEAGSGYTTTPVITLTGGNGTGAVAYAIMGNDLVRSMKTTIKYDRYQYNSDITDWSYLVSSYPEGTQVRYLNRVWQATNNITNVPVTTTYTGTAGSYTITVASTTGLGNGLLAIGFGIPSETTISAIDTTANTVTLSQALVVSVNSKPVSFYEPFLFDAWTEIDANTLSGIDRTQGFYFPSANMPGRQLPLVINGLEYPGVQVYGLDFSFNTGFDVGNYDINPFDNISYGPEGRPTYDPALLDAIYESSYVDPFLGTRPTDINVDGGAYVDTYSSHAPEELVPGAEFDTLDFRVYTTPGEDNNGLGHGFPSTSVRYTYDPADPVISFAGALPFPFVVIAFNVTLGLAVEPISYDWANYELTFGATETAGDTINVFITGVGGGNELYINSYLGSEIGDQVIVPFSIDLISEFLIYNGEIQLVEGVDYTYESYNSGSTIVNFDTTYGATDRINLATLGYASSGPTQSWSLPVFETIVADGSSTYPLTNSIQGTNPVNLIVTVNGARVRPYQNIAAIGNGLTQSFDLPNNNGYNAALMDGASVAVYVDNILQTNGSDYIVNPYDGTSGIRNITFSTAPVVGAKILLSVDSNADYQGTLSGDITFITPPAEGDIIEIVSWNDTAQQGIETQVFVGPSTSSNNTFDLGHVVTNPERLLVTLNGLWLFNGLGFTLDGSNLTITGPTIDASAVLAVTSFTNSIVPPAMAFRIFQDMRGIQDTYRITPGTTTTLVQALAKEDDIVYVNDASVLTQPSLGANFLLSNEYHAGDVVLYGSSYYRALTTTIGHLPTNGTYWEATTGNANIWGVITINGERIMYRYRDTVANTVSGLMRGTAGTAAADHANAALVYDMGLGNLAPKTCQNIIETNVSYPLYPGFNQGNGSTTVFTAEYIYLDNAPADTIEIYLGGERVQSGYTITDTNPIIVEFDIAPPDGIEVAILVRRGHIWYSIATPELSLNETDTYCARFLRGAI